MSTFPKGAIVIEGHIQGLSNTRSVGEMGLPVYVVDRGTCLARYSKYCKKFFKSPDYQSHLFIDFLIKIAEQEKLSGWVLFPSNDFAVININENWDKLKPYFYYFENSTELIHIIYNKNKLANFARTNLVPVPNIIVNEIDINFPIITRGTYGLNFYKKIGKKVLVSNSYDEYQNNLNSLKKHENLFFFTQELVSSKMHPFTVSHVVFVEKGKILNEWMGEKIRQHPIAFGTATYARSRWHQECSDHSKILFKALKYTGICEIEYQHNEKTQQFELIEINARTWLWVELAKHSGTDFAKLVLNYFSTKKEYSSDKFIENVYWKNAFTDSFIITKGLLNGKFGLKEIYFKKNKKVNAVLNIKDPIPSFAFLLLIPKIIFSR
jgi:predicted ATP-grasp superfamily ATP-dependent carboligase